MGRPTKLTAARQEAIVQALRLGAPLSVACQAADVSPDAVAEWIERGEGRHKTRRATKDYVRFAGAVREAIVKSQLVLLARVHDAAKRPQEWRAAAWLLKARWPEAYGDQVKATVTHETGATLRDAIERIAAVVAEAEAEGNGGPEPR